MRTVLSVPDSWEYPWFALTDVCFASIALARLDPAAAKQQLLTLLDETVQHSDGRIPAYEWNFDHTSPPLVALAAVRIFELDGGWDRGFLQRALPGTVRAYVWWVTAQARALAGRRVEAPADKGGLFESLEGNRFG